MIKRILNKLGLYTKEQYFELVEMLITSDNCIKHYSNALQASEEAKANAVKENEKLKSDYKNVVAALKVCEDEKRAILAENEDLRRAFENRKKQVDLLLKDFERVSEENKKLKKEVEKLRLKVVKSVKRKRR